MQNNVKERFSVSTKSPIYLNVSIVLINPTISFHNQIEKTNNCFFFGNQLLGNNCMSEVGLVL